MKTFICGNSHVGAIKVGIREIEPQRDNICAFSLGTGRGETSRFFKCEGTKIRFCYGTYEEQLKQFTGKDYLDPEAVWGFVMGTHTARLYGHAFWKNATPFPMLDDETKQPVTIEAIDACIAGDQRYVREFLTVARNTGLKIFVISCPPPRADHRVISKHGVRPEVLQFIHHRARDLFLEFLGETDIGFVDYPAETTDENGFLLAEYNRYAHPSKPPDQHHANRAYGCQMAKGVLAHVDTFVANAS